MLIAALGGKVAISCQLSAISYGPLPRQALSWNNGQIDPNINFY